MIDPKKIEQIARQVHESMPKGIREFGDDVEKKIRQTLQAQLVRLDLVSREEFDVQTRGSAAHPREAGTAGTASDRAGKPQCAGRSEASASHSAGG